MRGEGGVGEPVGIDRLQLAVRLHRRRLERLVPVAKLLAPILPPEDLFRTLEALWELAFRNRRALVPEAVDVRYSSPSIVMPYERANSLVPRL